MKNSMSNCLYCLKGLGCIAVVLIHCPFPTVIGGMIRELCFFAVPAFFMISGYYSYQADEKKIKSRATQILKLLSLSYLLYFLMGCILNYKSGTLNAFILNLFSVKTLLIEMVIFSHSTLWGAGWYLIGMAETYVLWLLALKKKKVIFLLKLTPYLFLLGAIINVVSNTWFSGFGRFFFIGRALPWFLIGILIRDKMERNIFVVNNGFVIIVGSIFYIVSVLQIFLDTYIKFGYIGRAIYSLCLFLFALSNNEKFNNKYLIEIGKTYSTQIYIYHMAVISIISFISNYLCIDEMKVFLLFKPIICIMATLAFCYLINGIKLFLRNRRIVLFK